MIADIVDLVVAGAFLLINDGREFDGGFALREIRCLKLSSPSLVILGGWVDGLAYLRDVRQFNHRKATRAGRSQAIEELVSLKLPLPIGGITIGDSDGFVCNCHIGAIDGHCFNGGLIIAAFSVRDSASHRCACPLSVGVRR